MGGEINKYALKQTVTIFLTGPVLLWSYIRRTKDVRGRRSCTAPWRGRQAGFARGKPPNIGRHEMATA